MEHGKLETDQSDFISRQIDRNVATVELVNTWKYNEKKLTQQL